MDGGTSLVRLGITHVSGVSANRLRYGLSPALPNRSRGKSNPGSLTNVAVTMQTLSPLPRLPG